MKRMFLFLLCGSSTLLGQGQAGSPDPAFRSGRGADGTIQCFAVQSDGKILVGGDFLNYNGTQRQALARINADGTIDASFATGTGADGSVYALAIQRDGKIIAGGNFGHFRGALRSDLVRINRDGSLDNTFSASGTGGPGTTVIYAISVQSDGSMWVGGNFTQFGGRPYKNLVLLNSNGSIDPSFPPENSPNGPVRAIAQMPNGKTLVAGRFTQAGGNPAFGMALFAANGLRDREFRAGTSDPLGTIRSLKVQPDGKVLVGGTFNQFNGQAAHNLVRINPNGLVDGTFMPGNGPNASVNTIALQADGRIFIGGDFSSYDGRARSKVVRLMATGRLDDSFNTGSGANGLYVNAVFPQASGAVIGGNFTSYNGALYNRIVRLLLR